MTHRQWRFSLGTAFVLAIVGLMMLDRSLAEPVASPIVVAVMGIVALYEYLRMDSGGPLAAPARAVLGLGVLLLGGAAVWPLGGGVTPSDWWLDQAFDQVLDQRRVLTVVAAWPFVVMMVLATVWMGSRWRTPVRPEDLSVIARVAFGAFFVALPLYLMTEMLRLPGEGELFALTVVLGAKFNDMGGYIVGSSFGRRKLCPGISPNKTWEGALGGLVAGTVGTALLATFLVGAPLDPVKGALLGLALGVATQLSDLTESAVKRSCGVKDSGNLIPAFGGILDLVDSLIFAAPVGYTLGACWLS